MVIPGYVLAGGRSSRMGCDKALLHINGVSLSRRMVEVLESAGCHPVHLVGRQDSLHGLGCAVVSEGDQPHHPLHGVSAALADCSEDLALIAPCDLIQLTPEAIRPLLDLGEPCVAAHGDQVHPLLAVLPTAWSQRAHALAVAGESAHRLVETLPKVQIAAEALHDANRPDDLPQAE